MSLLDFRIAFPTIKELRDINSRKLLPMDKLDQIAKDFGKLEQVLLHKVEFEYIESHVSTLLTKYKSLSNSLSQGTKPYRRTNSNVEFDVAATIELHLAYAVSWCRNYLESHGSFHPRGEQLHAIAKKESNPIMLNAYNKKITNAPSRVKKVKRDLSVLYTVTLLLIQYVTILVGWKWEGLIFNAFITSVIIINEYGILSSKHTPEDIRRITNRVVLRRYIKPYRCTVKQLMDKLGVSED